jgi:hypothetical protein
MSEEKNIDLDPEAQKLFEQFGGLQAFEKGKTLPGADRLAQKLLDEQKRYDAIRILMVQTTLLISRYLRDERFSGADEQETRTFATLTTALTKLGATPGHLGCMLIRFRGTAGHPDFPDKFDYEIVLGHTGVDYPIMPRIVRRNGDKWAKLPDQMREAFTIMSDYGVNNIFVRLPGTAPQEMADIQLCLKILGGFRGARQSGAAITVQVDGTQRTVPLINDENQFPDPNLTLLAGLNRLSAKAMEGLVDKVDRYMRQHSANTATDRRYTGVYNAAMELPKIQAQVKRPPVELNNVKWLMTEVEAERISPEKMRLAQLAMEIGHASPQQVAKMIQSVYGEDYARINKALLGERLHLSSHLLNAAEKQSQEPQLAKELLGNLQNRLDMVKDQVIDDVHVVEDTGEERRAGKQPPLEAVHSQIYDMVKFYKGRSATRKKMVGMVHHPISFTDRDYAILSKDFRIALEDAKALVQKLKNCFTMEGRFKKSAFTEAVEHFRQYEQKIFQFLWDHMKDVVVAQDRAAFLNALQALTTQMDQPKKAVKILLEDLCADPNLVRYSDNKAIMLANLIVHREKSLTDYDITPEDIVLNRHNIDSQVAQYATWRIEKGHEDFSNKVQTIHRKLNEALQLGHTGDPQQIPAAVLINLERELYIFLSLVACETGKAILQSAAGEYGDPAAKVYHQKESENCLGALLQNLRVSLRGVGSVGGADDIPAIEHIKENEESFGRLKNDRNFRAQTRLIGEWVNEAVKLIKFRA